MPLATSKGVIQLAGDLTGTAASPQIAAGAIVNADINASAAISRTKLDSSTQTSLDRADLLQHEHQCDVTVDEVIGAISGP